MTSLLLRRLFALFFAAILSSGSSAVDFFQWSPEAQRHAKDFSAPNDRFKDPFFFTAYGAIQAHVVFLRLIKAKYRNYVSIPSEHFYSGSHEVLIHVEEDRKDLVVALPGIATSARSPMMNRALDMFSNRGFHTAVIDNSWSKTYLDSRPKHLPGDVVGEARAVVDLLRGVVRKIGVDRVNRVHLYGESYGGFLAAAVAAIDAHSVTPLIDGGVTLAGLPIDLRQAASNLDALIVDARASETEVSRWEFARLFWDFLTSGTAESADTPIKEKLPHLITMGVFYRHLKNTISDLNRIGDTKALSQALVSNDQLLWENYIQRVRKTAARPNGQDRQMHNLFFWLEKLKAKRPYSYRIVSSHDEFLNKDLGWDVLEHSPQQMILVPFGGHLGFQGLPWWEKLLDLSFGERTPGSEAAVTIGKRRELHDAQALKVINNMR